MFEAKALFQMKFYALVIWRTRGVVPAMLQLVYLGNGEMLRYVPDEADLLATERKVEAIWRAIRLAEETGDWRPSPARLCDWCCPPGALPGVRRHASAAARAVRDQTPAPGTAALGPTASACSALTSCAADPAGRDLLGEVAGHPVAGRRARAAPGRSVSQRVSCRNGQRVWNRQPVGGFAGEAGRPASRIRSRVVLDPGSGTGTADISAFVYGCSGSAYSSSEAACSTMPPRYITATSSETWRTTARSWAITR